LRKCLFVQAFGKITKILQSLIENRGPREEDEALEKFLKFQPLTFFGEVEQDQKAELWLESIEDILKTLLYSKERMVKLVALRLRGPTGDWWMKILEA
jgi:hypothetical protein